MIHSFANRETAEFFEGALNKKFEPFQNIARRKLLMLFVADSLDYLRSPPSNRLEALKGDRKGQYSIRINDRYRVCFRWDDGAHDVEIVDYH